MQVPDIHYARSKDLVAGSGLVFHDRGEHDLKGIPDRWLLYGVVP